MKLQSRLEGAVLGGIAVGILGQVPPFTALPEEFITVPIGAVIGALVGSAGIKRVIPKV